MHTFLLFRSAIDSMASVSFPGNVSFGGTVTSPLFVSNQQIIAPFAAGTASTLSVGSFASTFSNVSQAYAATLTVGTILNFSAGGTLGTNLILSGSINAVAGSISTLTVGSLATTFLQAATLSSASTYLDVIFNQTSSSSGTTSSTYQMGTLAVGGGGSFAGTLAAACFTNQAAPLYTLDVAGGARITTNLGVGTLPNTISPGILTLGNGVNTLELASRYGTAYGSVSHISAFNAANNVKYPISLNGFGGNVGINTTSPQAALDVAGSARVSCPTSQLTGTVLVLASSVAPRFTFVDENSSGQVGCSIRMFSGWTSQISSLGHLALMPTSNVGINTTTPAYTLDVTGSARVTGNMIISGIISCSKMVPWTNVTFQNGASQNAGWQTCQFSSDELGYVRLRGLLVPSPTLGAVSFTLPASCRPPGPNGFRIVVCASNSPGMLTIGSDGGVALNTGNTASGSYVFLDNICFPTS